jgi:peptidoglycan/LPS O-acetylase OafA/YrhL
MDGALRVTDQAQARAHTPLEYRPDIDGLRAMAIVWVIAFHAFPEMAPGGFVGVDVFFVISGFLITSIILKGLESGEFSFAGFYAGRVRRLLPALCLMLITLLVAGWHFFLADEFRSLGKNVLAGIAFVSNFVLWQEAGYFDSAAESKPLLHLWSLGIEEQFYIAWPLLLYVARKRGMNLLRLSVGLAIASFALNAWLVHRDPVATFYLPVTRFWEILAGSVLALTHSRTAYANPGVAMTDGPKQRLSSPPWSNNLQAFAGLSLLLIAAAKLDKTVPYPGYLALLPITATVLLISAGPQAWLNRHVLSQRMVVWVGLISYALYLWHWPALVFLRLASAQPPSVEARFAAIGVAVVLAWLTFELVDKPIRYGPHASRKALALCTIAAVTGIVGAAVYHLNGMPSRFAGSLQKLAAFQYDYRADYREGTCFLRTDQDASAFQDCSNPLPRAGAPSIVLWGDSHAAHLYPGLKASLEANVKLTQLTASQCPPIVGLILDGRPQCKAINDYVLRRIGVERPDRVILAALWNGGYDSSRIVDTIRALREQGVRDIELIGPVPHWKDGLPRALYREALQDTLLHRIPRRTRSGLIPGEQLDATMRELSEAQRVVYVSPWDTLCNANGCQTVTDGSDGVPIAWDEVHLTAEGSRFLVSHFPPALLAPSPR